MLRTVFFSALFVSLGCSSTTDTRQKQPAPVSAPTNVEKPSPLTKENRRWKTIDLAETIAGFSGTGSIRVPHDSIVLGQREIENSSDNTLLLIKPGTGLELSIRSPRHDRPMNVEQALSSLAKRIAHKTAENGFVLYQQIKNDLYIHGYFGSFDCQAITTDKKEADIAFEICTSYLTQSGLTQSSNRY